MREALLAMLLAAMPVPALAWGNTGHRYIGELAARNFPKEIPAFLRTRLAAEEIGMMAQEPDISRNAGQPHDGDSDPGHFLDVSDDGSILGGPQLSALPDTRRDYDTALRAVNSDEYKAGFLPYSIMDGWQQLVKDFALLRRDMAAQKFAKKFAMTPEEKKFYARAQAVRQILTLRDLGVWAHYVGDASQPMHVSVHYNGWGEGANPQGFTATPGLHAKFESDFVNANISEADVGAKMTRPYQPWNGTIKSHTENYLGITFSLVGMTYNFEKQGAYDQATPEAKRFVTEMIAVGALALRDMVTDAWRASGDAVLGYKNKISVADIEAGKADPRKLD